MGLKRLDIARLGEEGEVTRSVSCLGGRVSVFRSNSPRDLHLYTSALRGIQTEERFSVLLDGGVFNPEDHLFIGFGEDVFKNSTMRVTEFLSTSGAPWSAIDAILLEYGLGGLSGTPCHGLSAIQQTILRLVGSWFEKDKVIVLCEPFAGLSAQLRERLGAKVAQVTWESEQLVIVTDLKNRPDAWLENPYIARIPLEPPRKATIGFGSDAALTTEFIATIRSTLKKVDSESGEVTEETPPEELPLPSPAPRKKKVGTLTNPTQHTLTIQLPFRLNLSQLRAKEGAIAAFTILGVILISKGIWSFVTAPSGDASTPPPQMAELPLPPPNVEAIPPTLQASVPVQAEPFVPTAAPDEVVPAPTKSAPYVLEGYPEPIKLAVLKAFESPLSVNVPMKKASPVQAPVRTKRPVPAVDNVPVFGETLPEEPPEVRFGAPPVTTSDVQNEEELEARRAQLRQSFLEAVERSRALQNPMSDFPGQGEDSE